MSSDFMIAIHALAYLQTHNQFVSSEKLAKNMCVNAVRVRKVMSKLKKAYLVTTHNGLEGGYQLLKSADDITFYDIYLALNQKIFHSTWRSGDIHMDCIISSGMAELMEDVYADMENVSIKYLKAKTLNDVVEKLSSICEQKVKHRHLIKE